MEIFIEILNDSGLLEILSQPDMLILIGMALLLQLFAVTQSKKSKSGRSVSSFAGNWTKYQLVRQAKEQLKKSNLEEVCLYCGSFHDWQLNPLVIWFYLIFLGRPPSLFVPNANPGIQVIGAPGMGKTFNIIDRLLFSAIDQGFPILLYDYKYGAVGDKKDKSERKKGQTPLIASYAARHGYNLRIFAPGNPDTCIINPLDFLRDKYDFTMARTLIQTYQSNIKEGNSSSNEYFKNNSLALLEVAMLMAKGTKYPDFAMVKSILNLPDLAKRIKHAYQRGVLDIWHWDAFKAYIAVEESDNDGAATGILSGALAIIAPFVKPDLVSCFVGKTNVALDLLGKDILIFKSDMERRASLCPLIASNIELIVNRNFRGNRKIPLILCMDEYPTFKSIQSIEWPSTHRSNGLVMIVGYQAQPQLLDTYDKNKAEKLNSTISNRFWFNPQNEETAKEMSNKLGKKEIKITNRSKTTNRGNGGSTTVSIQYEQEPLLKSEQIQRMKKRCCIYTNQNSEDKKEAFLPEYIPKIKVSKEDLNMNTECVSMWHSTIENKVHENEKLHRIGQNIDNERILKDREELSLALYYLPEEKDSNVKENFNINTFDFME
jgi:type IV secretion system protein VirD4